MGLLNTTITVLFMLSTHPLQMKEYPLQYASTDRTKKSHYKNKWIETS